MFKTFYKMYFTTAGNFLKKGMFVAKYFFNVKTVNILKA